MIAQLKKSRLGKAIYVISRSGPLGWPLLMLSRLVQSEPLQPTHIYPRNLRHNARQRQILAAFDEASHR